MKHNDMSIDLFNEAWPGCGTSSLYNQAFSEASKYGQLTEDFICSVKRGHVDREA